MLWSRSRPTRENTHSLSSANELRGCEVAARPDLRSCCAGTPFEESPFHEGGAHLTSQPRPLLLLPFTQGTGPGSIGLAPGSLPRRAATSFMKQES